MAKEIEAFTGYPTRIVWMQDTGTPQGGDYKGIGKHQRLKVFCTEEGRPRVLHHQEGMNYYKPLITPSGETVVFSNVHTRNIYRIPWEGGEPEQITAGRALATWKHTETGEDWIYFTRKDQGENEPNRLFRRPVGGREAHEELLWDRTNIDQMQISADGNLLAVEFHWPDVGFIDLTTGHWQRLAKGCWPGMAPDNSYLLFIFTGTHRAVEMFSLLDEERWATVVNNHPDLSGKRAYHPQWSNHPDFISMTGPYAGQFWENRTAVNLFLARFNQDRTAFDAHLKITDNGVMDIMPYVWINHGMTWEPRDPPGLPKDTFAEDRTALWPATRDHLVFLWRDLASNNEFHSTLHQGPRTARLTARDSARFGSSLEMLPEGGWFETNVPSKALAAKLSDASDLTVDMVVHFDSSPEFGELREVFQFFDEADGSTITLAIREGEWVLKFKDHDQEVFEITHPVKGDLKQELRGKAAHVGFRLNSHSMALFTEGRFQQSKALASGLRNWRKPVLKIGGNNSAPVGISHLSVVTLPLPDYMLIASATAALNEVKERQTEKPEAITLRARVAVASETPDPGGIEPYRRALVSHEYEVLEVAEGDYSSDRIVVAHWALMDGQVREEGRREAGQELWMRVEPQADHPQLEGEFMVTGDEDIFLEPYYQVDF